MLPHGFRNRDLRGLLAGLLGKTADDIIASQASYDLRHLRAHGLINRIPRSHRYRVTDAAGTTPCCSPTSRPDCCNPAWPSSPTPTHPHPAPSAPQPATTNAPSTDTPSRPDSPRRSMNAVHGRGVTRSLAITIRWIWLVPSKICRTFASRM